MVGRLLTLDVPSLLLHLLMWGSCSVPNPHVLGLILDGPHCSIFNEKDERGAGWENTQPSSSPSTIPFTLLLASFVQPCISLTGPPALTHVRLFSGVGEFYSETTGSEAGFHFKVFRYYSLWSCANFFHPLCLCVLAVWLYCRYVSVYIKIFLFHWQDPIL